ncbi:MAG: hypothetical protein WBB01_08740, partial [Phormidesmis sp.]
MSLPIVLEITIGLIFIYLTLSLVASEIQEILSALLQWRAEHLKRSIEQLLAGDAQSRGGRDRDRQQNRKAARVLADRLYDNPLIENLNYEAQGRIASFLRSILHGIGAVYRVVTFSRNVFGDKTSGPSYIPAETFATSLIERLKLHDFQQLLVRSRFNEFAHTDVRLPLHNMVNELRARLRDEALLDAEMVYFDQSLDQISTALETRRITLETAITQVSNQLQSFETMSAELPRAAESADALIFQSFLSRVGYLRRGLDTSKTTALLARLSPSLSDLTELLDPSSATYAELVALAQQEGDAVLKALDKLQEVIPPQLQKSLATLSNRAEAQIRAAGKTTGAELQQLQIELEAWFNRGMERASGVYRRNVK